MNKFSSFRRESGTSLWICWQLWSLSPECTLHSISGSLQKPRCPSIGLMWENSLLKWILSLQCCIYFIKLKKQESTDKPIFSLGDFYNQSTVPNLVWRVSEKTCNIVLAFKELDGQVCKIRQYKSRVITYLGTLKKEILILAWVVRQGFKRRLGTWCGLESWLGLQRKWEMAFDIRK